MPDIEHSTLTGSEIHEPKGADTANEGEVYIADGLGSGDFAKISQDSCLFSANPFGQALLYVREEQTSGTAGGTFTSGSWQTRTLNTSVTNEISGASLGSNQITLPAGTYFIWARAPGRGGDSHAHKAKLRNVTDNSDTLIGSNAGYSGVNVSTQTDSIVLGRFTIAAEKDFELQHRTSVTTATSGLGLATSFGVNEVYTEVMIWRIV